MLQKCRFFGNELTLVTRKEALAVFSDALADNRRLTISYLNAHNVVLVCRNRSIAEVMRTFDITLAEGLGAFWAARFLGCPMPERLAGNDLLYEFLKLCRDFRRKVFLLGASPDVAEKAAKNLEDSLPGLVIAGVHHGWFKPEEDAKIVGIVNASGADCLLMCLGVPRQHLWVAANRPQLQVRFIMMGGGYLDQASEAVDWYPKWIDRHKLYWLYRLWREPRRLWRRYTLEMLEFCWWVLRARRGWTP